MRHRRTKIGLAALSAVALSAGLLAQSASADYAPSNSDVVGVGSDTLQYLVDFVADGDVLGDPGYNAAGNVHKWINFDATADGNARIAYGPNGIGSGQCTPGTGGTAGTANQTATHGDTPCILNPTIVLRQGLNPTLRPNGSGNGFKALIADQTAGHHFIDYSRSSSKQTHDASIDVIQVGNDPFNIVVADTTNAVPLSAPQLKSIYEANSPNCLKWTDVGGTSADAIIPIIPQTGSGTFSSFKNSVGITNLGNCGVQFEENDPTSIYQVSNSADAIAPISGGRLNLFLGKLGDASSTGKPGYFRDPSCPVETTVAQCTVNNNNPPVISPAVHQLTAGAPSDGQPLWNIVRPLYIYFRAADVAETAPFGADHPFQPGSTLNWVRTLFYNPCSSGQEAQCVTIGGTQFGPGGKPYIATAAGQALISASGISPTYVVNPTGA